MSQDINEIVSKALVTTPAASEYVLKELWSGAEITVSGTVFDDVPAHGVKIYKVRVK